MCEYVKTFHKEGEKGPCPKIFHNWQIIEEELRKLTKELQLGTLESEGVRNRVMDSIKILL